MTETNTHTTIFARWQTVVDIIRYVEEIIHIKWLANDGSLFAFEWEKVLR